MERKQTRCADDKDIYPGFSNLTEGFLIARAINFRQIVIAIIFAHVDELSNLVQRLRNKLLSGIAGSTDMTVTLSSRCAYSAMLSAGVAGFSTTRTFARILDLIQQAEYFVIRRLGMKADDIGAGLETHGNDIFRMIHHQMNINGHSSNFFRFSIKRETV